MLPFTKDELVVQVEALREYRMRLRLDDVRKILAEALIYRLVTTLMEMDAANETRI